MTTRKDVKRARQHFYQGKVAVYSDEQTKRLKKKVDNFSLGATLTKKSMQRIPKRYK